MKEEVKQFQLKVRVTNSEKEKIQQFCEEHNWTISDFLRVAANKLINQEEN